MLHHIDTLIGFAAAMSVISLLVTIVTQMVSALFGLRARNISDAIEAMAHRIDPEIDAHLSGLAKKLADTILTHPLI